MNRKWNWSVQCCFSTAAALFPYLLLLFAIRRYFPLPHERGQLLACSHMGVQESSGRTILPIQSLVQGISSRAAPLACVAKHFSAVAHQRAKKNNLTHTPLIHHHSLSWLLENDFWWKAGSALHPLQAAVWQIISISFQFLWFFFSLPYLQMYLSSGLFRSQEIHTIPAIYSLL